MTRGLARAPADRQATAGELVEQMAAPESPRETAALMGPLGLAAAVVLGLSAAWWGWRATRSPVPPGANVIAVMPPEPATADTTLVGLGRGLAVTLSASLDQVGGLRTIEPLTVTAQLLDQTAPPTLDQAVGLARRLGAGSVLEGTLTRNGASVRLDLALFDTRNAQPIARAFATAPVDDPIALTDSATWALLRQVWRAGTPPTPSFAAITTRSLPALRAFLDGEQAMVESRWPEAQQAFAAAVGQDSTFWLARFRLAYALGWQYHRPDSAALVPLREHLDQLPEPERLLALLWDATDSSAYRRGLELTQRYPDYWPGWFEHGDRLFHDGPLAGHPLDEARAALERAVELNPRLLPAWAHLLGIATTQQDGDLMERVLRVPQESEKPFRALDRLNLELVRGKPFEGPGVDTAVALALSQRGEGAQQWSGLWFTLMGFPAAQLTISRRVLQSGAPTGVAEAMREGAAVAWAARGAWDSAMVSLEQWVGSAPTPRGLTPYRLAVLGVWLGGLNPEAAPSWRDRIRWPSDPTPREKAYLAWLDGMLAVARGDRAGLARAREESRVGDQAFGRSLDAFDHELAGQRRAAAESLYALAGLEVEPNFQEVVRLAAARWLSAEGDQDRAVRLLYWPEANIFSSWYWYRALLMDGVTYFELAKIEQARGNATRPAR